MYSNKFHFLACVWIWCVIEPVVTGSLPKPSTTCPKIRDITDGVLCDPKFFGFDGNILFMTYANGSSGIPYASKLENDQARHVNASKSDSDSKFSFSLSDFTRQSAWMSVTNNGSEYVVRTPDEVLSKFIVEGTFLGMLIVLRPLKRVYVINLNDSMVVSHPFVDVSRQQVQRFSLPLLPRRLIQCDPLIFESQRLVGLQTSEGMELLRFEEYGIYRVPNAIPGIGNSKLSVWVPQAFLAGSLEGIYNYSSHVPIPVVDLSFTLKPYREGHDDTDEHHIPAMVFVWVTITLMIFIGCCGALLHLYVLRKVEMQKKLPPISTFRKIDQACEGTDMEESDRLRLDMEIQKLVHQLGMESQQNPKPLTASKPEQHEHHEEDTSLQGVCEEDDGEGCDEEDDS